MKDLSLISPVCIQANTKLGWLILSKVWRCCNKSPMDDGQVLFHKEDYEAAENEFSKYGLNVKFPIKM